MKKTVSKIIALVLALCLALPVMALPSFAATQYISDEPVVEEDYTVGKTVVKVFGAVADTLITAVSRLFPTPDWPYEDEFVSEYFYEGHKTFQKDVAENAQWQCGFASDSILPDDFPEKGYVAAGEFHITETLANRILEGDDQRFSAIALDDGSGNGTVIFASLDGFGMTSTNVRKLRSYLDSFAKENNIVSINVSISHTHSGLDTHGLGASILGLVGDSALYGMLRLVGIEHDFSSTDDAFMTNLFETAEAVVKTAYADLKPGTLTYNAFDISDLIYDKQYPVVFDPNVNQIKFVPDDAQKNEIWLVNMGVHPVKMADSAVSADYPGAIVRYAKEMVGADVAFYQGAQLAITREEAPLKLGEDAAYNALTDDAERRFYVVNKYGKEIVTRILNNDPVETMAIDPILNIAHTEVKLPVGNSLLLLIAKIQMINNLVVKTSWDFTDSLVVSEVGYCELGKDLAIAIMPGEIEPAIVYGGVDGIAESWNNEAWPYAAFVNMANKKLLTFGITNDQIGYIIPDNDYAHPFASLFEDLLGGGRNKHYEEMISLGPETASTIAKAFRELVRK